MRSKQRKEDPMRIKVVVSSISMRARVIDLIEMICSLRLAAQNGPNELTIVATDGYDPTAFIERCKALGAKVDSL